MGRTEKLTTKYSEYVDRSLDRFSHALALSRAGSYGYDDYFRDWMQAIADATITTKEEINVILSDAPDAFRFKCLNTGKLLRVFTLKSPAPQGELPGEIRLSDGKSEVPFAVELTDNRQQLVVRSDDLSALVPGVRYTAEVQVADATIATLELLVGVEGVKKTEAGGSDGAAGTAQPPVGN